MTTSTAAKETEAKHAHADAGAILFELEGLASGGRRATFEALKKAFAEQDVKFTPAQFSRFCLHPSPDFYAEELPEKIGAKKVNGAKLLAAVKSSLADYFGSNKITVNAGLVKLIEAGQKHGLDAAAITALPEDIANTLLGNLGLAEKGVRIFSFANTESHFPRPDVWLKACKQLGKSPRSCIAVSDHMVGCKSALSASVKSLAIPNEYTAHQDYCGADLVIESWDEMSAKEILEAIAPAK